MVFYSKNYDLYGNIVRTKVFVFDFSTAEFVDVREKYYVPIKNMSVILMSPFWNLGWVNK